jgi:hypothetical protein
MDGMREDSFIFYRSFSESMEGLSDSDTLALYRAIVKLGLEGEKSEVPGPCKGLFTLIVPQIEANRKKRQDGRLGGRPPKKETRSLYNTETRGYEKEKPNVNENGNENENVNGNGNENKWLINKDGIDMYKGGGDASFPRWNSMSEEEQRETLSIIKKRADEAQSVGDWGQCAANVDWYAKLKNGEAGEKEAAFAEYQASALGG